MSILPRFGGFFFFFLGAYVLLFLKTRSRPPPMLLQPFLLLLAWSGAELRVNGGNGGVGDPSVTLHTALLTQPGHLGPKWLHSSGKRCPPPRRGL